MGAPKQTPAQIEAKKQAILALKPEYLKHLSKEEIEKFNGLVEKTQIKRLKDYKKGNSTDVKVNGAATSYTELKTALNAFNSLVTKKISKLTVKDINTIKDLLKKSDELIDNTLIENEKAEKEERKAAKEKEAQNLITKLKELGYNIEKMTVTEKI